MLKSDVLSWNLDNIMEKPANEEKYTYTMGNFVKYDDAEKLKERLLKNDFGDAAITPYYRGVLLDKSMMIPLIKDFPELEIYLKSEEK
jgi:hypothetical protein